MLKSSNIIFNTLIIVPSSKMLLHKNAINLYWQFKIPTVQILTYS